MFEFVTYLFTVKTATGGEVLSPRKEMSSKKTSPEVWGTQLFLEFAMFKHSFSWAASTHKSCSHNL
jgi:hypothetical protein